MNNIEIANIILEQIGGMRRMKMMTGASNFAAIENGVQFNIGSGAKDGINKVVIVLTPADLYKMSFWHIPTRKEIVNGAEPKLISEDDGIFNDMLMDMFEEHTGFYLTLRARS